MMPETSQPRIDPHRYRKLRRFFFGVLLHALWWDVILNRRGLSWLRKDPLPRWREIARRYRSVAVEMGGVLIKLGQFLSIRVDVLPAEILRELAGLQDEVPPERYEDVVDVVEAELERPVAEVFPSFSREPAGAASLAQAHRATLPSGEEVVIKVLRPGIEVLVETDLAAIDLALKWLERWKLVARRVDLERLAEEFRATTSRELDFVAEAESAERFAEMFADDPKVRVPAVHGHVSTRRVLVLEDVGYLKLADRQALLAAGIDPGEVARTLYAAYMEQLFVHNFVHADPHPGNLFVEPLPTEEERRAGRSEFAPGEIPPPVDERDFRVIFIDFGMTAGIPEHLRGALRQYLYGLGQRDARKIVEAYSQAGVLLPGADLDRLVEAHEDIFDRFWGVPLSEMRDLALSQARSLMSEYRDLIYEIPFQMQVDLLFASRAVGILAGLATSLDPKFDPWAETIPFAERMAAREAGGVLGPAVAEGLRQIAVVFALPNRLDRFLDQAEEGNLTVRSSLVPDVRKTLERLERIVRRLIWTVAAAGLLVTGAILQAPGLGLDDALFGLAGASFLWGLLRWR